MTRQGTFLAMMEEHNQSDEETHKFVVKTARKLHICVGCGKAIRVGQQYWGQQLSGPWQESDPEVLPLRLHVECGNVVPHSIELPREWRVNKVTGQEIYPGPPAPLDHKEVGWGRDTASKSYRATWTKGD